MPKSRDSGKIKFFMKGKTLFIMLFCFMRLGGALTQERDWIGDMEDDWEMIIDGYHPSKYCSTNIEKLFPADKPLNKLESSTSPKTGIDCLDLEGRGLEQIFPSFVQKFPNLKSFNLANNKLDVDAFFKSYNSLAYRSLNLDGNKQITTLKIAGNYPNLRHLYLRDLGLRNFDFPSPSGVTHLYLSGNELSQGSINFPESVTHLFLNRNNLSKLPTEKTGLLRVLSIRGNNFEKIGCTERPRVSSLCLGKFRNLERLFLGGNSIFEIEPRAFDGIANLLALDLSFNHVERLDQNCLNRASGLKSLNLSGNPLTEAPKLCVLANLEVLILDHTRIIGVEKSDFCGLKKLKTLWLNDAGIESISVNSFGNLISLEELRLEENQLSTLEGWQIPFSLRRLFLQGNLFKSLADATRMGTAFLEYLDLRRNQIADVQEHSFNISKLHIEL